MHFGNINRYILFGGGRLLVQFAQRLKQGGYDVIVFSSRRHLIEVVGQDGTTLGQVLRESGIAFFSTRDINDSEDLKELITDSTLGIGMGEVWSFRQDLIDRFGSRLLDLMTIPLPQYRGGAHYSWQILRRNKIGCCHLQVINAQMIPGVFDSGEIIKSKEYFFPSSARTPKDYFDAAVPEGLAFLEEFVQEVQQGKDFPLRHLQESFSIYFPRLSTLKQGFIDWSWSTEDIELFICAFDEPYPGASTFVDDRRVFLKNCYAEYNDGPFHPFQAGLIFRKATDYLFVATRDGTLVVRRVLDESGADVLPTIELGQRFYTRQRILEEAMTYHAIYDADGLVDDQTTRQEGGGKL